MAEAVILWSPVIIIGLIPALIQLSTASVDSTLGGSIIAISPTKVKSFSSSNSSFLFSSISLKAKAKTLSPFLENSILVCCIFSCISSVNDAIPFEFSTLTDLSKRTSRAPLVIIIFFPEILCMVLISFLSESKGNSCNLSYSFLIFNSSKP
ncbi:hypothetical protein SDC9_119490 [bioreactor metagenome]|uniref:Uncharacterized protein n=1 Tax=bioreactor metagenome TaxID=1076179 RepID=A0A645C9G5_9ZZZZ